jgi:CheY-like chemotaxis protein
MTRKTNLCDVPITSQGAVFCSSAIDIPNPGADLSIKIRSALLGKPSVTSASAPARQAQPSLPRRVRILIADDERRIRLALRSCLEAEGYIVDEAEDGLQALDLIIRSSPDVMILDLAMPNLDGMRTLSQLQGVHGQLKPHVIVLTAWGSGLAMMKAIGLGADLYLEKPLDPETLRRAVASVLKTPPTTEGVPIDWTEELSHDDEDQTDGGNDR